MVRGRAVGPRPRITQISYNMYISLTVLSLWGWGRKGVSPHSRVNSLLILPEPARWRQGLNMISTYFCQRLLSSSQYLELHSQYSELQIVKIKTI